MDYEQDRAGTWTHGPFQPITNGFFIQWPALWIVFILVIPNQSQSCRFQSLYYMYMHILCIFRSTLLGTFPKKTHSWCLLVPKYTSCILYLVDGTSMTTDIKKMVQLTKDEMETQGLCQLVKQVTRFWPGQPQFTSGPHLDQCTWLHHVYIKFCKSNVRPTYLKMYDTWCSIVLSGQNKPPLFIITL